MAEKQTDLLPGIEHAFSLLFSAACERSSGHVYSPTCATELHHHTQAGAVLSCTDEPALHMGLPSTA